jgi:chorismate dehydratase
MRLTAVSYLNTKPFIYGLFRSTLAEDITLSLDIPAVCAQKLLHGEADLALTPVAIIPELPQAHIVSDFCIGSEGPVRTVCLFAERPLPQIKRILLDHHSRSSVMLTRLLCAEHWRVQPEFVPAQPGFEADIGGDTAALVIGDRAIGLEQKYPFVYDLGEAWTAWTGLPFVFAAWVSTRPLPTDFTQRFNAALADGLRHLPELSKIIPPLPGFDLERYYRENISYGLDERKMIALQRFLRYLAPGRDLVLQRSSAAQPAG